MRNYMILDFSVSKILYDFVTGNAAVPHYYVLVLIQLTLITPLFIKKRVRWLYLVTPAYLVLIYLFNMYYGRMPQFYETMFPAWLLFYILGIDARRGAFENIRINKYMLAISMILCFVEAFILLKSGSAVGFVCSQIRFTPYLFTVLLAIWLTNNENSISSKLLSKIGDGSFGMFFRIS